MRYSYSSILLMLFINIHISCFSNIRTSDPDTLIVIQKQTSVAFGTQPGWMVTGSLSSVKGDDLQKSFASNLANTLYGRIPGLTVSQGSGEPGMDAPVLNARGVNTFGTGRGLLIIVDGFLSTEAFLGQLSPYEIESISLLKDASATAVFGNRGANGVLLVNTKKGNEGMLKINFTAQYGLQKAMRLPEFLGSYDYARLFNEGLANDGEPALYSASDLEAYQSGSDPIFHPDVDWYDEVLRSYAPAANYDLNFSGGNKTIRYFVMLNVLDWDGLYKKTGDMSEFSENSTYSRYNFRTNVEINLSKRLSATILLSGSVEDKKNPGINESTNTQFNLMASVPPNAFPVYVSDGLFGGNSMYTNPLGDVLRTGFYTSNGRAAQASFKLTEQLDMITPGLSISGAASFSTFFKAYSYKTREYTRYSASKNSSGETVLIPIGQNTSLEGNESRSNQWRNVDVQGFINYSRAFGLNKINAMLMANYDDYTTTGSDLNFENVGIAGRITYSMKEKYIGEFSFGYNGSENFAKGKRFGFFPAASLGWVISNEDFLKENTVLSYLKVRGSYGLVGNNDIGGLRFMFDQYYNAGSSYYFGTTNSTFGSIVQGMLANPDVTWEKEKKLNAGIEMSLFGHVDLTFDLFKQDRYDILAKPYHDVPQFLGITMPDRNVGKVNNKGFEATVRYTGSPAKDLSWFAEVSLWYAKNKIVYNAEAVQQNEYLYSTGHPVGQPFLLEAIGFISEEDLNDPDSPNQIFTTVQPGDLKYKDQNKDRIIDQNDYYPVGKPTLPEITFGLHTGIQFKGFDVDANFQGVTNRSVYLSGKYFYAFQDDGKISSFALGRWTRETASTATYPRLSASNNMNNFQPSSFWQRNGSFIKLRSLEVGYTIPQRMIQKARLNGARIFLNGTNLFSLDHMDGFTDPETIQGYPALRTISLGIHIQL
ncbi:MAG: SusC/RagA family TonB-linked outer membrane protein [Mangrovibacterium sp.]